MLGMFIGTVIEWKVAKVAKTTQEGSVLGWKLIVKGSKL